eukprot:15356762-Ditylum_brightwellii.AAC.1
MSLLSVSPLCSTVNDDDDDDNSDDGNVLVGNREEAVNFTADKHAIHFKDIFSTYYNTDLMEWAVCQIADTANVNVKVENILRLPHISCKNHNLNLEVNYMCKNNNELQNTIDSVHETMTQCKQRLTNAALLRSIVNLGAVMHNKT